MRRVDIFQLVLPKQLKFNNKIDMKKSGILLMTFTVLSLSSCIGYRRMGDLTMISNRNVNSNQNYVLLKRDVEVKIRTKKKDFMEIAIDEIVSSVQGGEYLMNTKLFLKKNGKKFKLVGDVWGVKLKN